MNNFDLIQEHFAQLHCSNCDLSFSKESIKLIREEKDYWVVRVCCSNCSHSPGFAIVGIEYESNQVYDKHKSLRAKKEELSQVSETDIASELENDFDFEKIKFQNVPKITDDDVIDAHNFIQNLGEDWMKYLKANENS